MPPYEPNRTARSSGMNPVSKSSLRAESLPLLTLGVGALLGLLLGLILGWLVIPVQWSNAWPADLSDEARAQYLAAVSEAYVYYGDAQAAEIARNRLFNLNEDLAQEIASAQQFFAENPQQNSRIYISNLGQLAQALGIESPDIVVDTAPSQEGAPADSAAAPAETEAGGGARSWLNWLLWLLAAVALVIGGLFVISRLSMRRTAGTSADFVDDETDGFDDEDDFDARPGRNPFQRPAPMPTSVREADRPRPSSAYGPPQGDDYGFDEEHDDPADFASGTAISALDAGDDDLYDTDYDEAYDEAYGEAYDEAYDDARPGPDYARMDDEDLDPMGPTATLVRPDDDYAQIDEEAEDDPAFADAPAHSGVGTLLKTFTVHYQTGIPDYEQAYSIMDPTSGRYIGECGMGVNLKNNILQNNPDVVLALDIWLVDKKNERTYSSQSRVLMSEYVSANNLESAFTRERPNDAAPLVPQPGMTFQLEGPNLVLDCAVREVKYLQNGPAAGAFQSIKLDMRVRAID